MVTVPTIAVENDQVMVLINAFGDADGYREWLRSAIYAEVRSRKINEITAASIAQRNADVNTYLATLSSVAPPVEEPVV